MERSVRTTVLAAMLAVGSAAVLVLPFAARAQMRPAAIVEDVAGSGLTVEVMDILAAGSVIELGPGQRLVLGYMNTCIRERIEGGSVVVGEDRSRVTGGRVTREVVACQSRGAAMAAGAGEGSGLIFRGDDSDGPRLPALRSRRPVFFAYGDTGVLRIARLDKDETPLSIAMPEPVLDLQDQAELSRGGEDRAELGNRAALFSIHPEATKHAGPVLERLVRLETE